MLNYYLEALKKSGNFNGRAGRKEYWCFILINFLISALLEIIKEVYEEAANDSIIASDFYFYVYLFLAFAPLIFNLAMIVPTLALTVRRLHDTNHRGWWIFVNLIPFVGLIVMLIFLIDQGEKGANRYGPPAFKVISNKK